MPVLSEANLADLAVDDRWDAEYRQPDLVENSARMRRLGLPRLGSIASVSCSAFYRAATDYYQASGDGGLPFLRAKDVVHNAIISDDNSIVHLPQRFVDDEPHIVVATRDDVILSKVGTPGFSALLSLQSAALTRTVLRIAMRDCSLARFMSVFLRSRVGRLQLIREQEQQVQFQLTLDRVRKIRVYLPRTDELNLVNGLVNRAMECELQARARAESISTLLQPYYAPGPDVPENCVTYSSVVHADRWDADYYTSPGRDFVARLDTNCRVTPLRRRATMATKGRPRSADNGNDAPYISIKHLRGYVVGPSSDTTPLADSATSVFGDILVAITGATIGKVGINLLDVPISYSADLARVRCRSPQDRFYVLAVLATPYSNAILRRAITGSTNGHLAPRWIDAVPIPELGSVEQEIADLMKSSLELREESQRAVRRAIAAVDAIVDELTAPGL